MTRLQLTIIGTVTIGAIQKCNSNDNKNNNNNNNNNNSIKGTFTFMLPNNFSNFNNCNKTFLKPIRNLLRLCGT